MKYWIGALLIFGLGGCVGQSMTETKVDFIEVPKTKIITETVEVPVPDEEVEYRLPESCRHAMELAERMQELSYAFNEQGQRQISIISQGRQAVAAGDTFRLTEVEMMQRRLRGDTIPTLVELSEKLSAYQYAKEECEEDD